MAAALSALRGAFAGISPRERRMLLGLAIAFGVLFLLGGWLWTSSALSDLEAERAAMVDALRVIRNERGRIYTRQRRSQELGQRYVTRAPALTSFVEEAARAAEVTVAEANDRTVPPPEGSRFQKRSVSIRLRRVTLQALMSFLQRVERAPFPVAVTGIRIRKRFGESNSYDIDDLVITTWDRLERATPRRGSGGSTSGGSTNAPQAAREL